MTRKFWRSRWKYGWILIGIGLAAAVVIFGDSHHWSAGALVVIGIVVAAYIAFPPMIAALNELGRETSRSHAAATTATDLTFDPALKEVARQLGFAFDTIEDAHDVGAASGLRMDRVRASRRADFYWQQILTRAVDEGPQRVDLVLDEALARSEREPLHEAVRRYREQRG